MLKKKMVSVLLVLAMCLSISAPAVAATPSNDEPEYDEIVVFSDVIQEDDIQLLNAISNEERIQRAKEGVLALNLSEMGLDYLETACLSQLDAYAANEDIILEEYTVLVPKAQAASSPTFFKTYRGYNFYTDTTGKATYIVKKNNFATSSKLTDWYLGLFNLVMCFQEPVLTIPWTVLSSMSACITDGYTVYTGDFIDCCARVYPTVRALYIKEGSSYINVYNCEFGRVEPYTVYHFIEPVDKNYPTETVTYNVVQYPDISSSTSDSLLNLLCGNYEGNMYPTGVTIATMLSFKWV